MQNRDGVQKGPQDHAEGQHGSKTRSKILEQLHSGNGAASANRMEEQQHPKHLAHHNSAHRLFEDRQQHDEAERNSEKTRHNREVERGHLDEPQIPRNET
jgi:protein subunit release factor B